MDMVVWSLRDWERQGLDRSEVEALLKDKGYIVSGWTNNTPRLANGTLLDAQRVIEESRNIEPIGNDPFPGDQPYPESEPTKKKRRR